MTLDEFVAYLRDQVRAHGSQKAMAAQVGLSEAFLSEVLRGTRAPSQKVLQALGFQKVVTYQPIGGDRI